MACPAIAVSFGPIGFPARRSATLISEVASTAERSQGRWHRGGRGKLVPDYLRELFSCIKRLVPVTGGCRLLTDASLAALATVSLELPSPASVAAVKMHRTRLSNEGFPGAWPVRKKKPAARKPRGNVQPVRPDSDA